MKRFNKESVKKGYTKVKSFISKNKKAIITGAVCFTGGIIYESLIVAFDKNWKNRGEMHDSFVNDETGQEIYVGVITPNAEELYCNRGRRLSTPFQIFVGDTYDEMKEKLDKHWK